MLQCPTMDKPKRNEGRGIEVEGFELAESELGPDHCPNCGGEDFYELQECGEVREVCADCGRRVLGAA
jgi:hypothetical protein